MKMNKPNYSIVLLEKSFILIRDEFDENNPTITVTNAVEDVVTELYNKKLITNTGDKRLFYIDSDGEVDEIIYKDNVFLNFKFGYRNEQSFYNDFV